VRITEPMTMITDYVMGALAFVLAMRLAGDAAAGRHLSGRLWAAALVMTAAAAFLGGTYHGFIQWMPGAAGRAMWKATLLATGVAAHASWPRLSSPPSPDRSGSRWRAP